MAELGALGDSSLFRVNALEQQAELADLKRQLDGATVQGRRQEQRLRQHRTSLRELIRQLEEVEERVEGVQRRVDTVSKSIHRSAEAVELQERRAQQLDQLANSCALKRGASAALVHGSPDAKNSQTSRLDMKIDDKLEELERRLWQATQDFDRRLVEEAERRAAGQEEVLGVLGQGVQQMRSEQARHASELNDNLRAEQRRWRQCISDAQAQQGDQQQHIEALEARLDTAVEALSLEYKNLCAALPKILPAVSNTPKSAVTQGASSQTQPKVSSQPRLEHQIRVEQIRSEPDLRSQTHHPNPEILMRLEALEGRYREPRSQGQASLPNSPRTRVALAEAERVSTPQAVTQPAEALTTTRTNLNGVHQGLGLTPPAGLTVEPIRLAPAQCLPSVPVSTTPEPPWQGALPSLASRAPWLDARPGPSGVSPRSVGPQEAEMLFKMQVTGPEVPAAHPQSLQPQQAQSQNLAHPPRQSLSPESPTLPWSPITGSLAPAAKQHGRGRGQSPPNSPGPNLGRNSPPLEPPMSHPSYPQPFLATRLPAPPGGGMMRECFA